MKPRNRERAKKMKRLKAKLRQPPPIYTRYESEQEIDGVLEHVWIFEADDPALGKGWHVGGLLTTDEGKARFVLFGFPPVQIAHIAPITIQAFDGELALLRTQADDAFALMASPESFMVKSGMKCKYEAHEIGGDANKAQLVFAGYPWAHCFGVETGGHG